MNVGKSKRKKQQRQQQQKKKEKKRNNLAPLVLESSFMAKGSVMSCKERLCPLGGWVTVPKVTWLYSMFFVRHVWMRARGGGVGVGGLGQNGWMGHFHKSPYSLSHAVILDSLLWVHSKTRVHSTLGRVWRKVLCFPYVLRITLNAAGHWGKAATSCKSSTNNLVSIRTGKAGGLFFFFF